MIPNLATKPAPIRSGGQASQVLGQVLPELLIFCHAQVLDRILDFSGRDSHRECGGFLLGGIYRHSPSRSDAYIEIRHFVPAQSTIGEAASLRFTHETWQSLTRELESQYPRERVVGWHHTHPGLGIFFSAYDRFVHHHFFPAPWHIAMVVDPRKQEFAFFQRDRDRLIDVGFVWVPSPNEHSGSLPNALQPRPLLDASSLS